VANSTRKPSKIKGTSSFSKLLCRAYGLSTRVFEYAVLTGMQAAYSADQNCLAVKKRLLLALSEFAVNPVTLFR